MGRAPVSLRFKKPKKDESPGPSDSDTIRGQMWLKSQAEKYKRGKMFGNFAKRLAEVSRLIQENNAKVTINTDKKANWNIQVKTDITVKTAHSSMMAQLRDSRWSQ